MLPLVIVVAVSHDLAVIGVEVMTKCVVRLVSGGLVVHEMLSVLVGVVVGGLAVHGGLMHVVSVVHGDAMEGSAVERSTVDWLVNTVGEIGVVQGGAVERSAVDGNAVDGNAVDGDFMSVHVGVMERGAMDGSVDGGVDGGVYGDLMVSLIEDSLEGHAVGIKSFLGGLGSESKNARSQDCGREVQHLYKSQSFNYYKILLTYL